VSGEVTREHRKRVRIRAEMRVDAKRMDVVICNVSSRGLLLSAEYTPQRGTYIELSRAGVVTVARVMWANDGRFGVQTRDKLDVSAMNHAPAQVRRMILDPVDAASSTPAIRTMGRAYVHGLHHAHHAEQSRWAGARMQFVAIGGAIFLAAAMGALVTYQFLSNVSNTVVHSMK
jgi:hypothetical protein